MTKDNVGKHLKTVLFTLTGIERAMTFNTYLNRSRKGIRPGRLRGSQVCYPSNENTPTCSNKIVAHTNLVVRT
jgi:hypothetical protein